MRRSVGVIFALVTMTHAARAEPTTRFAFEDGRYLEQGQREGATVYVSEATRRATGAVPLVVFLHGVNPLGRMHLWMGGLFDLRPVVDGLARTPPFVLAAPSQTRDAKDPKTLWPEFDVDAFVSATETALGAPIIDKDRVYVIGHSGAGCNTDGGLARLAGTHVAGVLAVDTCLDEGVGTAFKKLPGDLWVVWQWKTWWRDIDGFKRGLDGAPVRIDTLTIDAPAPHDAIVPEAFRRLAREWLGLGSR